MENVIYVLTCNGHPMYASYQKEKLQNKIEECIDHTLASDNFTIVHRDENSVTYHTGITYVDEVYDITPIDVI